MQFVEDKLFRYSNEELEKILQTKGQEQRILKYIKHILSTRHLIDFLCAQERLQKMSNDDLEVLLPILLEMEDMVGIETVVRSIMQIFLQRDGAEEAAQADI